MFFPGVAYVACHFLCEVLCLFTPDTKDIIVFLFALDLLKTNHHRTILSINILMLILSIVKYYLLGHIAQEVYCRFDLTLYTHGDRVLSSFQDCVFLLLGGVLIYALVQMQTTIRFFLVWFKT